jgi:hypothetical protein
MRRIMERPLSVARSRLTIAGTRGTGEQACAAAFDPRDQHSFSTPSVDPSNRPSSFMCPSTAGLNDGAPTAVGSIDVVSDEGRRVICPWRWRNQNT